MTEQEYQTLADIDTMLAMLRRQEAWPKSRAVIQEIRNRYRVGIQAMRERRLAKHGRDCSGNFQVMAK